MGSPGGCVLSILAATFVPSTMLAQINMLFVKQGTTLNRIMGHGFKIPPTCLTAFVTISTLISVVLYDRYFVPFMRRWTKNPRGISLLKRIGTRIFIYIVIMVMALLTECHRLAVAKDNGTTAVSVQFVMMGIADAFLEVGKIEFFYDQAPESMNSLGTSFAMTTLDIGNFLSSFMLSTAAKVMRRGGYRGWIFNKLNQSLFDYYYTFTVLNVLNFFLFAGRFDGYREAITVKCWSLVEQQNLEGADERKSRLGSPKKTLGRRRQV